LEDKQKEKALKYLKRKCDEIDQNNAFFVNNKSNYEEKLYNFSYLSDLEFQKLYLGFVPTPLHAEDNETVYTITSRIDPAECEDIPEYKNWAEEGKVNPVRNQAPCGCCYLFAAVETIETAMAIEYNLTEPVKLSTQHTLQCVKNMTNGRKQGCEGDSPELIWRYARDQGGLVAESSFDLYTGNPEGECVAGLDRVKASAVEYWGKIPENNEEAMKCYVAKYGVLSVGLITFDTGFEHYSKGIYDDYKGDCTAEKSVDHVSF
jgi:Papain family cysteine protease